MRQAPRRSIIAAIISSLQKVHNCFSCGRAKSEQKKWHLQPRWRLRGTEEKHWRSRAGPLEGALTYQPTCITLLERVRDGSSQLSTGGGDAGRCERRAALCATGAPGSVERFLFSSCLLSPPLTRLRCVQRDLGEPH